MTRKPKIVADKNIPFLKGVLDHICDIEYLPWQEMTKENLHDADALVTRTRTNCNKELLEGSSIKIIATATIGYDHIDTEYCDSNGIAWTNAPGCNSGSVEQYILAALLVMARKKQLNMQGMTIGIIGVGHVGSKVERISRALGLKVLLNDPPRERNEGGELFVSIDRIKEESDFITFHVPLTPEGRDKTLHIVDDAFLRNLRKRPVLINTSRGKVVDGLALKNSIIQRQLSGCVLDVWEGEPAVDSELLKSMDIGTPHIAGYSADGKANGSSQSVQSLSRFFKLGMDNWSTSELPAPVPEQIVIDGSGMGLLDVVTDAVLHTYDILKDDGALRSSPLRFEQLRAEYPVRREMGAYKIKIINDEAGAGPVLENLGFQVLSDYCF